MAVSTIGTAIGRVNLMNLKDSEPLHTILWGHCYNSYQMLSHRISPTFLVGAHLQSWHALSNHLTGVRWQEWSQAWQAAVALLLFPWTPSWWMLCYTFHQSHVKTLMVFLSLVLWGISHQLYTLVQDTGMLAKSFAGKFSRPVIGKVDGRATK